MYGGGSLVARAGKWACNEGALLNYNPTVAATVAILAGAACRRLEFHRALACLILPQIFRKTVFSTEFC